MKRRPPKTQQHPLYRVVTTTSHNTFRNHAEFISVSCVRPLRLLEGGENTVAAASHRNRDPPAGMRRPIIDRTFYKHP